MSTKSDFTPMGDSVVNMAQMSDFLSTMGMTGTSWRHSTGPKEELPPSHFNDSEDDNEEDDGRGDGLECRREPVINGSHAWTITLPIIGRLQLLKDKQGLLSSSVIVLYWVYGNWSTWMSILLPRYFDNKCPIFMLILYGTVSILCIMSFLRAVTMNPGYLSVTEQPGAGWSVCQKCFNYRPPQAHHCRRCGHCVRRMDHHCPWINNCVGEDNQYAFMLLVFYAYMLSLITLVLDILQLCYLPPCEYCDHMSFALYYQRIILWIAVVMAIFMTCGGVGLYFSQHMSIVFNTPSLEFMRMQQDWFASGKTTGLKWPKQTHTVLQVYQRVCGDVPMVLWLLPCIRRRRYTFHSRSDVDII